MNHKIGHYIVGGEHYDPHSLPPAENRSAIVRRNESAISSVDDLLKPHEDLIVEAQESGQSAQIVHPDYLELCYLGLQVIRKFPDDYPRYLAVLEGYMNARAINQKVVDVITNMIERNKAKSPKVRRRDLGIGAMTEPPPQPRNQS